METTVFLWYMHTTNVSNKHTFYFLRAFVLGWDVTFTDYFSFNKFFFYIYIPQFDYKILTK